MKVGSVMSATAILNRKVPMSAGMVGVLLFVGLLSVLFAPGDFLSVVWLLVLAASGVGVFQAFTSLTHDDGDKKLKGQTAPVPLWTLATLVLGTVWTAVAIISLIGFLIGLLLILLVAALFVGAGVIGYKLAKRTGKI
jgi:hypothetical protein